MMSKKQSEKVIAGLDQVMIFLAEVKTKQKDEEGREACTTLIDNVLDARLAICSMNEDLEHVASKLISEVRASETERSMEA